MYRVINNIQLNDNTFQLEIQASNVASHYQAGQFVIIRGDDKAERIPLTIAGVNLVEGTITLIFQAIGVSTKKLSLLQKDSYILDVLGPLGTASHLPSNKRVLLVSGGVGTAIAIPTLSALASQNNEITSILGFRTSTLLILEDEIRNLSKFTHIVTDDGSLGQKGFVTDVLKELLTSNSYDFIYCIGPIPMMKAVVSIAKQYNIPIQVSLNPIMIDGTGMCGGCRVTIDGKIKFACIDGPEFDGHLVDFDELLSRNKTYDNHHKCRLEAQYEK